MLEKKTTKVKIKNHIYVGKIIKIRWRIQKKKKKKKLKIKLKKKKKKII